jgi:uncharacterized membrane protein YjjP (DUF1212 family)
MTADISLEIEPSPGTPESPPTATQPLDRSELGAVLSTVLHAGQLMLEAGAETARVEEVVHRMGIALGADWMDVYITPTGIIAMATSYGEHRTRVQRVRRWAVDMARIDALTDLSRRTVAQHLPLATVQAALHDIGTRPRRYGPWSTMLAVGFACAAFAGIFGGDGRAMLATFVAAALAQALRGALMGRLLSPLVMTAIVAAVATATGYVSAGIVGADAGVVMTASVLLVVPGVFLVGSVSDLINGNLVSGVAKGAYAALLVCGIGAGVWFVLYVIGRLT